MVVVNSRGGGGGGGGNKGKQNKKTINNNSNKSTKKAPSKKEEESPKKKASSNQKKTGKSAVIITPAKKGVKIGNSNSSKKKDANSTSNKSRSSSPSPSLASTSTSASSASSSKGGRGQKMTVPSTAMNSVSEESRGSNNTKGGDKNGVGSRYQAQRKFAQIGNFCVGNNSCQSSHNSPYATPSKDSLPSSTSNTPFKRSQTEKNCNNQNGSAVKKVKQPMFSPPPCKRPKTEDFLTFLCVRGTPSLPPELDFFNYPQVFDTTIPEVQANHSKKKFNNHQTPEIEIENNLNKANDTHNTKGVSSSKVIPKVKSNVETKINKKPISTSITTDTIRKSVESSITCIAENPTKGIRATASSVLLSKLKKSGSSTPASPSPVTKPPIVSPTRSRINEQDAKIALTALKLKYQRLVGNNKPNRSALLTKKAKESIILTRSKASRPAAFSKGKLNSPRKGKLIAASRPMKPIVISPSRNAPSPDIIFGVTSCVSAARKRARDKSSSSSSSSSSEAESDQEQKNNIKTEQHHAESSQEDEEAEEEEGNEEDSSSSEEGASESSEEDVKPSTSKIKNAAESSSSRSLRNGKELRGARKVSKSPTPTKKEKSKSKSPERRRVGTRSAHRISRSPLREIPMYKTKEKEEKKNEKNKKAKVNKKEDKSKREKSPDKKEKDDYGKRPSRKTKETAANLLGLFTHGFSSDEEEDAKTGKRREGKDEESDMGSSSSSETNYLEKHYNASLRREEEKLLASKKEDNKTRTSRRLSSKCSTDTPKSKSSNVRLRNRKQISEDEDDEDAKRKKKKSKAKGCSPVPAKTRMATRQRSPTVGDRKMSGAARKSATISYKGRKVEDDQRKAGSSSDERNDSEEQEESDDEDSEKEVATSSSEIETKKVLKSGTSKSEKSTARKKSKVSSKKKGTSKKKVETSDEDNDEDSEASSEEEQEIQKARKTDTESSDEEVPENLERDIKKTAKKVLEAKASKKKKSLSNKTSVSSSSSDESDKKKKPVVPRRKSKSKSPVHAQSSSSSSSPDESESSSSEEEPVKVDMAIQVDMDEEDGIITPSMLLSNSTADGETQTRKREAQTQHKQRTPSPAHNEDINIHHSDSDDSVQEIGQVFAPPKPQISQHYHSSSSTTHHSEAAPSSSASYIHPPSIFHQPHPGPFTATTVGVGVDPLHNNPFSPFRSDFYTPLQLAPPPPLIHSSIQLVGSTLTGAGYPGNPLNTLSIPVSVPFLPPPGIGFSTGSTFHSTTLQTHIRSVATANLESIPLVRPSTDQHFLGRGGLGFGIPSSTTAPLTRPPAMGVWSQQSTAPMVNTVSRNHYSAFRVPHLGSTATATHTTQHVIQSTTVLGMNSGPAVLPVSIIQPHQHQHQSSAFAGAHQPHRAQQQQPTYHHLGGPGISRTEGDSNMTSVPGTTRPRTPTPPGYHLIKHLPNVSIVPKFDRSAHQAQSTGQDNSSGKHSAKKSGKVDKEPREKKKVGRKPKEAAVLPHPSSPLTVRKDSNPATYSAPKKTTKEDEPEKKETEKNKSEESRPSTLDKTPKKSIAKSSSDDFSKLLKKKGKAKNSPVPSSSSPSSSTIKGGKSESPKVGKKKKSELYSVPASSSNSQPSTSTAGTASPGITNSHTKFGNTDAAGTSLITEAPAFYPTEQDFEDPLKYIQKIQGEAEKYGIARIVPPKSFRPECNVEDDMRFAAYNHYIHKMYQRWGSNVQENEAIKQNLKQNQVEITEPPMIGGMEIDLSTLYQTVKSFGGLTEVIAKQRWTKVADSMHIPKAAHDRASKLDAIYVKYVLPYETLSDGEREKLKKKVEKKWNKRKEKLLKAAENSDDEELEEDSMDELDDCIVKGKSTPLSSYYRVARNTMNVFFSNEQKQNSYTPSEIEDEYWKIVKERNRHVCVYSGSIDCAGVGWGFPNPKANNKHPWNLKALSNNQGSVLRSMGPVMGTTVPTLHVAMLFTSYCWYRDPHALPWLEYLHSGATKIWYSVPGTHESVFRSALMELMPMQHKKKKIWLPSDSAMVPPELLLQKGVPLVRALQNPGEFLVVFPKAFTAAICTGYLISESVCFAYPSWLQTCVQAFKDIMESKEPPVFPLEKLLISILQDARASLEIVRMVLPFTKDIVKEESSLRKKIISLGVKYGGKMSSESGSSSIKNSSKKKASREEEMEQCHNCNYTLYLSVVRNSKTDAAMCLKHAIERFSKHKSDVKKCNLFYDMDQAQLEHIIENATKRCENQKVGP